MHSFFFWKQKIRGKTICPKCHGTRLKAEANYVKVGGRSITELVEMPIGALKQWMEQLTLTPEEEGVAQRIMTEIRQRLQFLTDVGLEYLTLNRPSASLSGGESQRINLATSLELHLHG